MSSPAVTCIIIVYNGEAFLDEAIASVVAQSCADWELVIADDGSTDMSREIALRYAATDPRIRLVEHPDRGNHGMSATRNLGLSRSRGDHIGFLDADDVWEPTKIEEQLAALSDHPTAAMVYGRTLIWRSWQKGRAGADFCYDLGVPPDRIYAPPLLFRNLIRNVYQTPTTCNALLRRSVAEEVGGFEESFRTMFEDQVFFAKILLRFPVFVSDRCWARYRQHERSSSATSASDGDDDAAQLRFLRWLRRYLAEQHRHSRRDRLAVEEAWARACVRIVRRQAVYRLARDKARAT